MTISINNLSYCYKKDVMVLNDASFFLSSSDMASLLGKNGAGKSTLFKLMLNLLNKKDGSILIDGKNIESFKTKEIAKVFSYIPQSSSIEFGYRVLDAVLMGSSASISLFKSPGKRERDEAVELLEQFGIAKLKERRLNSLSGGERQLVLLARALMQKAAFIILDEPTSNLDYSNQIMVLDVLKSLNNNGIGIIYSTHNPESALNYSNKILTLKDGKISTYLSPEELAKSSDLKSLYDRELYIEKIKIKEKERYICLPI